MTKWDRFALRCNYTLLRILKTLSALNDQFPIVFADLTMHWKIAFTLLLKALRGDRKAEV